MSEQTNIGGSSRPSNECTRISLGSPPTEQTAFGPRESFIVAYDRMATLAKVARRPSVVVAAVGPYGQVLEALLVEDRRALVVGRHTHCALRLSGESVSLRHLALLVRYDEQGAPVVHLWDLNTGHPFLTEDQQPSAAVIAEGPVYAAIGSSALWVVPSGGVADKGWPAQAEEAWHMLAPRQFIDRRSPRALVGTPRPQRLSSRHARDPEHSFITMLGPALALDDSDDELPWGEIRIELSGHKQKRRVSAERLEQGVLIGRYERCGIAFSDRHRNVSRVHLLLVRIAGEIWAIDTASTHGLWRGEHRVTAEVLADPDQLKLGDVATIAWRRLPMAAA